MWQWSDNLFECEVGTDFSVSSDYSYSFVVVVFWCCGNRFCLNQWLWNLSWTRYSHRISFHLYRVLTAGNYTCRIIHRYLAFVKHCLLGHWRILFFFSFFLLQKLYYVQESHGIVVTDLAFLPDSPKSKPVKGNNEVAMLSVAVDSRCQMHTIANRSKYGLNKAQI